MMEILTFFIVIIAGGTLWQSAFNTNSFLFEKKLNYYKDISKEIFEIINLEVNTTRQTLNAIEDPKKFDNVSACRHYF